MRPFFRAGSTVLLTVEWSAAGKLVDGREFSIHH
jgi:hypothetical protein